MLRIGLTGGIGSGKSTVAGMFARLGAPIIDTDAIAHELTRRGAPGYRQVITAFGEDYLGPDGELDRRALGARVFRQAQDRHRLEAILHPLIRAEVVRLLGSVSYPYVVIVVPLLLEAGFTDLVDRVLVVDASAAEQIRRARARSALSEEEIRLVMQSQLDRKARLAAAHDVLSNEAGLGQLEVAVGELHRRYLATNRQPG